MFSTDITDECVKKLVWKYGYDHCQYIPTDADIVQALFAKGIFVRNRKEKMKERNLFFFNPFMDNRYEAYNEDSHYFSPHSWLYFYFSNPELQQMINLKYALYREDKLISRKDDEKQIQLYIPGENANIDSEIKLKVAEKRGLLTVFRGEITLGTLKGGLVIRSEKIKEKSCNLYLSFKVERNRDMPGKLLLTIEQDSRRYDFLLKLDPTPAGPEQQELYYKSSLLADCGIDPYENPFRVKSLTIVQDFEI